jgi:hypothetical protein
MAEAAALPKMRNAAQWRAPDPGRTTMSAPAKPAATASARATPTRSPRNSGDAAVTISGAVKLIAAAVARGTKPSA